MPPIEFAWNQADSECIFRHLLSCDADFDPPLSTRVDVRAYAEKLQKRAERREAWQNQQLVGLLAYYPSPGVFFISNLSVIPAQRRTGIAATLVRQVEDRAKEALQHRIELRVGKANQDAIRFYSRQGFVQWGDEGQEWLLTKPLHLEPSRPGGPT